MSIFVNCPSILNGTAVLYFTDFYQFLDKIQTDNQSWKSLHRNMTFCSMYKIDMTLLPVSAVHLNHTYSMTFWVHKRQAKANNTHISKSQNSIHT